MNDANNNPYPEGRWTAKRSASSAPAAPMPRLPRFAVPAELLGAPLRELFWGLPDSSLVAEARDRVEHVLAVALTRAPQPELHFA